MSDDVRCLDILNHAALRWLIARIRTSSAEVVATSLFDEFADTLDAHLTLIDELLMPALRSRSGRPAGQSYMPYIDTHWYLKRSLAELRSADRHAESFAKRLAAVCNRVERQTMREATELLALVLEGTDGAREAA